MAKRLRDLDPKDVREKHIEDYLRDQVRSVGGEAYKFTSPNRRSVPDRLCIFYRSRPGDAVHVFVECKRPGGKLTPAQEREHERLRMLGATVYTIDTFEGVDALIERCAG